MGVGVGDGLGSLGVAGRRRGERRSGHSAAGSAENRDCTPDPARSPVTSSSALKWLPVASSRQPRRGGGA